MMPWKITRRAITALLLCSLICVGREAAQAEAPWQVASAAAGQLQVMVMDQNGQPLPQVIVLVEQNDKTVAQERTTASGNALVRQLPPGTYKVLVEKDGFYTTAVPKLEIVSGQQSP